MRRLWVGLVLVAATVGACSSEGGDSSSATTAAVPVTTAAPTTSTTAAPVQTPLPTGEEAVDALLAAWRNGDRPAALAVASITAVDALFAIAPETGQARGCNAGGVNVNIQCVYRLDAGELQVRAAPNADGSGYLVDFVILGS